MVAHLLRCESFRGRLIQRKMSKTSGRAAPRATDIATPIDVVRDGASTGARHSRIASPAHRLSDGDLRIMREVSEDLRAALVPDRIAEGVARQLEPLIAERIASVLHKQLATDLRVLLKKYARTGFAEFDPSDLLNETLADALTSELADALFDRSASALRERLPIAIRAATARGAFARRVGASGIEDLADRLSAIAETTIRQRAAGSLRSVIRGRLGEIARDDARELLRPTSSSEDGARVGADTASSIGDAIVRAAHHRLVRGVMERFRALVASSLHHATGERLGDGLHRTLALSNNAGGAHKSPERVGHPLMAHGGLAERLENAIAPSIRAHLMDGLRDRVESTCRENIDQVLRERLAGATRVALAEQHGSEAVDGARLAEVITYELAEVLRARICDGIRARTAEAVRTKLADAIREGVGCARFV